MEAKLLNELDYVWGAGYAALLQTYFHVDRQSIGPQLDRSTARPAVLQQLIGYVILWNMSFPKEALSCEFILVPFMVTL